MTRSYRDDEEKQVVLLLNKLTACATYLMSGEPEMAGDMLFDVNNKYDKLRVMIQENDNE